MKGILKLIKTKGLSDIFLAACLVLTIVGLVGYHATFNQTFQKTLEPTVIIIDSIAIAVEVIGLAFGFKLFKYASASLALYALIEYINTQTGYLGAVFSGSDTQYKLTGMFIITVISYVLVFGLGIASAVLAKPAHELITKSFKEEK